MSDDISRKPDGPIDGRVLTIAETAWAMISDRNDDADDWSGEFQTFVYEQTIDWLIDLDQAFKSKQQARA